MTFVLLAMVSSRITCSSLHGLVKMDLDAGALFRSRA